MICLRLEFEFLIILAIIGGRLWDFSKSFRQFEELNFDILAFDPPLYHIPIMSVYIK